MTNRLKRRSIRLPGFDYASENSYFLTLVTDHRKNLFGEIHNDELKITSLGEIARVNWQAIPEHFPNAELDEFVIMPNHLHGIINLFEDHRRGSISHCKGSIYRAPTTNEDPPIEAYGKPVPGSIPTIIRTYKASVTRNAREMLGIFPVWQRNYYEHVIGFDAEYDEIVEYIHCNPLNWLKDDEYSP